jgi:hypothetical protein
MFCILYNYYKYYKCYRTFLKSVRISVSSVTRTANICHKYMIQNTFRYYLNLLNYVKDGCVLVVTIGLHLNKATLCNNTQTVADTCNNNLKLSFKHYCVTAIIVAFTYIYSSVMDVSTKAIFMWQQIQGGITNWANFPMHVIFKQQFYYFLSKHWCTWHILGSLKLLLRSEILMDVKRVT